MVAKDITLSSLLAASLLGNVYLFDKGEYVPVAVVPPVTAADVEIVGDEAKTIGDEMSAAETRGDVTCKKGVLSNDKDACYCTDGGTAGWISRRDCEDETIRRAEDGKLYSVGKAK